MALGAVPAQGRNDRIRSPRRAWNDAESRADSGVGSCAKVLPARPPVTDNHAARIQTVKKKREVG